MSEQRLPRSVLAKDYATIEYWSPPEDPAILKDALQRIDKSPNPETTALRSRMVDIYLQDESMQAVFPDIPLSPATDYFLRIATDEEVHIGYNLIRQRELQTDRGAFLSSLTGDLPVEQQQLCQERLAVVVEGVGGPSVDIFLRRLNGEGCKSIAVDYHMTAQEVSDAAKPAMRCWRGLTAPQMNDITAQLTPHFPELHNSVATNLADHLERIDSELAQIVQRLSPKDLEYMTRSFVDANLSAAQMAMVLMVLNRSRSSARGSQYTPSQCNFARSVYARRHNDFLEVFEVRPAEPLPKPTYTPYEMTDEATKLIVGALAQKEPLLSKEEMTKEAKTVEAGVYAEQLLAARAGTAESESLPAHPEADDEDLRTLTALGESALVKLLASNTRLVNQLAYEFKRNMDSTQDREALVMAGMRGLLRSIRKYDHEAAKLNTYAHAWVKNFIRRDIFKNDWQVSSDVGAQIITMIMHQQRLEKESKRELSNQELAEAMQLPSATIEKLQAEYLRVRRRKAHKILEEERLDMSPDNVHKASTDFRPATKSTLDSLFADQPIQREVIQMRFGEQYTLHEIGIKLGLPSNVVRQHLKEAVSSLQTRLTRDELLELLGS